MQQLLKYNGCGDSARVCVIEYNIIGAMAYMLRSCARTTRRKVELSSLRSNRDQRSLMIITSKRARETVVDSDSPNSKEILFIYLCVEEWRVQGWCAVVFWSSSFRCWWWWPCLLYFVQVRHGGANDVRKHFATIKLCHLGRQQSLSLTLVLAIV